MVRSLNQLIYQVLELYRSSYKVTDPVDERLVLTWIQQTRAKLLKQRFDENMRYIDEHNVQDLGDITLERVDSATATGISATYASNKSILRSNVDIPRTINRKGNIGTFTRIAPVDKLQSTINLVSYERAMVSGNGKFNSNDIYTYIDGNRLCFTSKSGIHLGLSYVNVKGVFVNPIEAYEFVNGADTYSWDYEYPVSEDIVRDMMDLIVKDNFRFIMTPLQDPANNATDDLSNLPNSTKK